MTNGANASYVNVNFAPDILHMRVNSPSVKWNPVFYAVVVYDMTLCPNEREEYFKFCVHLFGRMIRLSVYSSFNYYLISIVYIRNACFHRRNNAMNMFGNNRGLDLNVISKQVDTQRMSFD